MKRKYTALNVKYCKFAKTTKKKRKKFCLPFFFHFFFIFSTWKTHTPASGQRPVTKALKRAWVNIRFMSKANLMCSNETIEVLTTKNMIQKSKNNSPEHHTTNYKLHKWKCPHLPYSPTKERNEIKACSFAVFFFFYWSDDDNDEWE